MKLNRKYLFLFMSLSVLLSSISAHSSDNKAPLTVAERSDFTATSRYAEVLDFIHELQKLSSKIRLETLCTSTEDRIVPLLIIGDPVPSSPLDLKYDDRVVIYIQANIHAGEVEGKEASLMLARDILSKDKPPFLEKLVILIAPIFNSDGNEKMSTNNRRNQVGPEKGVGVRYNGQNLDLNRDSMKMESPEIQGLVQNVLLRWDPVLLVDCHTTNGSYHEEPVTYSWSMNPNGDNSIIEYLRDKMLPAISKNLKEKYQTLSIPYGNFKDSRAPEKGWQTFSHLPRFVTNYVGLRNRLAILDENYSYANYKTRVLGCYNFLRSILEYCAAQKSEMIKLVQEADQKTIQRGMHAAVNDFFAVEVEIKPLNKPVTIRGWEMEVVQSEQGWPRVKITDKKRTYTIPYFTDFVPRKGVQFPSGYLIQVSVPEVAKLLMRHGITVERLTQSISLEVESFKINELKSAERSYQGHHLNSIKGEYVLENKEFSAGTLFISTAQPLGNLIAALLEPKSDDGLLVWNFFDRYLVAQWRRGFQKCPVYRLLKPVNLVKKTLP